MRPLVPLLVVSVPAIGVAQQVNWSSFVGRAEHAMAYDPGRQLLVMHGGRNSSATILGDTWTMGTSGQWSQPANSQGLQGLYEHALSYAPNNVVVSFGGLRPVGPVDEMWEWDGNTWTLVRPVSPSPRYG